MEKKYLWGHRHKIEGKMYIECIIIELLGIFNFITFVEIRGKSC